MRATWLIVCLAGCGGSSGADSGVPGPDASTTPPLLACEAPQPLVDLTGAKLVGDGTPASCTEAALDAALAGGGTIAFNCGDAPFTLRLTAEKEITADTAIDGAGLVTLDGGDENRLLAIHGNYESASPRLVVQRLRFVRGRSAGNLVEGGGGAIFREGGTLIVLDSVFEDNHGPATGQDVAGGAITSIGGGTTVISGSVLVGNSCSNGGAIGNLGNDLELVNTRVANNVATGAGGNPGNGGNGGGTSIDGMGRTVEMCGVTFENNAANAYGGGVFRVSYIGELTSIRRSLFKDNSIPDQDPSMAGGLYLQGTRIAMDDSAIVGNSARGVGGLFVGPGASLNLTNVTIADNVALSSLAGGLAISDGVGGAIVNCTLAGNDAPGPVAFGGAVTGEAAGVTLSNSVIADNTAGNGFNPVSCTTEFKDGGGNLQFPVLRAGGGSDDPDALCAGGVLIADAQLTPLAEASVEGTDATTWVSAPGATSPAAGLGATGCPPTDQRGRPRPTPCAAGAVEP